MQLEEKAKDNLIDLTNISPQKKSTPYSINGWVETYKKSPSKVKMLCIKPTKLIQMPEIQISIQDLKKRKEELLKSTAKKKSQSNLNLKATQPKTIPNAINRLPLLRISQFSLGDKDNMGFLKIFQSPKQPIISFQKEKMSKRNSGKKKTVSKTVQKATQNCLKSQKNTKSETLKEIVRKSYSNQSYGVSKFLKMNQKLKKMLL